MEQLLTRLFDPATLGGLVALASIHLHLAAVHVRHGRELRLQRRELDVFAVGHAGDPADHRAIPQLLTEARRDHA